MKRTTIIAMLAIGFLVVIAGLLVTAPAHPLAIVRVIDENGHPVSNAVVTPEGMRTKPGPYQAGWYGWRRDVHGVPNPPVPTDRDGLARISYPKYVFERIETGKLCLAVNHPDYVPDRPERDVATAPPAGAPWRERFNDLLNRLRRKQLVSEPEPIVLMRGAKLEVAVEDPADHPSDARLFVQTTRLQPTDTNSWHRPRANQIFTRRLPPGTNIIRAVSVAPNGRAWFSETVDAVGVAGATNRHRLTLKPGVTVRGSLDESVPRPVTNGRVVAHVWPRGFNPSDGPPQWHQWSPVAEDGSFALGALPPGDLELVALCQGFVSTNGPGQFSLRYPQKHPLGEDDLIVTIGMEPTARLEVLVRDDQGNPLAGAKATSWCNVRYGEWSATILAGDCYNMTDRLLNPQPPVGAAGFQMVADFEGISDASGWAVIPNLPATSGTFVVEHPGFELPATRDNGGQLRRQMTVTLEAGRTNRTEVRLEPRAASPIAHY